MPHRIVTLHPFLSEAARLLGSNGVEVIELLGPAGNPHSFDPKPSDLQKMQGAVLVLAMGKNLEPYLDRIRASLEGKETRIVEAGRPVPSLMVTEDSEVFRCCPNHSVGALDPHWWHSADAMRRAVRGLEKEFIGLMPERKDEIRSRSKEYQQRLRKLHQWAKLQVARIPKSQRNLVTSHAGFGYFCKAYGLQSIPVQGLAGKQAPTQGYLSETIELIRREKIRAIFPEAHANGAVLETIRKETGAVIGPVLLTDNVSHGGLTYEAFFFKNVTAIVGMLVPQDEEAR